MKEKNETKFGNCPCCKQEKILVFALGQKKDGSIWCNWLCNECIEKLKKNAEENNDA